MKQWKRLAALSSAIVMAAATLTYFPNDTLQNIRLELSASAETTTEPQVWNEDNLTWTLTADGTLTISGTGAMKDYDYDNNRSPVYGNSSVKKVVIEDGVTSIGNYAFYNCRRLTDITIPKSVTSIGNYAFYNCSSLTSITIPDSVTSIGDYAFFYCYQLTSITLSDSVTSIGNSAFSNCGSLTTISLSCGSALKKSDFGGQANLVSYTNQHALIKTAAKAATCTEDGNKEYWTCEHCKKYFLSDDTNPETAKAVEQAEFIIPASHKLTKVEAKDPTCTEDGNKEYWTCEHCGKYFLSDDTNPETAKAVEQSEFIIPASHELTKVKEEKAPTCTEDGNKEYWTCEHCKKYFLSDDTNPETAKAVELSETVIPASHKLTKVEAKAPTCTESGNKEYWTCEHCKKYFLSDDTNPETAKAVEQSETIIPAIQHKNAELLNASEPTETSPGYSGDLYCPDCDKVVEKGYTYWNEGNLTWKLYADGTLTISGTGAMKNYNDTDKLSPACRNSSIKKVVIEDGVTSIGNSVFDSCSNLASITIPSSVTSIGNYAFWGCKNLPSITIPDSVTSIGKSAFSNCSSLTSITIPDGVTSIGNYAFSSCRKLTSITIPDSVTSIGESAFAACSSLTSITIPDSVTSIGKSAFSNCSSLTSITIPDSVTSIGNSAFSGCKNLTSITIPDSIISIGNNVFYNCSSLTSITIPDSVTSIGDFAFYNCSGLTSITIPDSVTSIGNRAFENCSSLTSITIPDGVTSIGDSTFKGCSSLTAISLSCGSALKKSDFGNQANLVSYTNQHLLTKTAAKAATCSESGNKEYWTCEHCKKYFLSDDTNPETAKAVELSETVIPASHKLTKVEAKAPTCSESGNKEYWTCEHCGKYFLSDDTNPETAKAVELSETILPAIQHKNAELRNASEPTETSPGYSGDLYCPDCDKVVEKGYTYWNEDNLTWKLDADGTLTISGTGAMKDYNSTDNLSPVYNNSDVKKIVIEEGVTSIGERAFSNCSSLTSITIPNSVTSIGNYAFRGCSSLTSITIPDSVTSIGYDAFRGCTSLTSITIPDSVTSIGNYAFYNCGSLTSITIPDSVTSIEYYAFADCSSLTSITIPDSVTSIGDSAFSNCTSLTSITIPDSVTSIGDSAFENCSSLTSITIPDSVTSIGSAAFENCSSLTSITIPDGVTRIGSSAFYKCSSLTSITIPDSVTSIGNSAFRSCNNLTSIMISNSVTSIEIAAFSNCSSLTSITIPDSVTSIGELAFYNCSSLTTISLSCKSTLKKSDFGKQANLVSASHTLKKTEAKDATCTEDGNKEYWTCEHCGKYFLSDDTNPETAKAVEQSEFIIPASHKLTKVKEEKAPTCTEDGNKAYWTCEHCGKYFLSDDTNPETAKAVEQSETIIPASHKLTKVEAKAATCTKDGNKEYWTCEHCKKYFLSDDTNPETAKAVELSETILPAIQHKNAELRNSSEPTETAPGYSGDRYCPDCDTVLEKGYTYWNEGNLTWKLDADGTMTISGTGAMKDYNDDDNSSPAYKNSNVKKIVIEDGVTSIGSYAFRSCNNLTSIMISNSVTSIGNSAFFYCTSLTSVTIPDNVTSIENYAFAYTGLKSITIPDSVTNIGNYAFAGCKDLTSITIPDSVTSIGNYAFYNCSSLTSITIPDSVTSIGTATFSGCKNLTSITIPDSVTSIGNSAFVGCKNLTSITIPDSVTSIGESTFKYCSNLKTISLSCKSSLKRNDFGEQVDLVSYTNQHLLTKTAAKDATCTEDGNKEYWTCEHCGKYFLSDDTNPETAKAVEQSETVIPASHKLTKAEAKAATCTEDGNKEYWTCEHCGKYFLSDDTNPETAKAVELSEITIPPIKHSYDKNGFCKNDDTHYQPASYNEESEKYEISNAGQLYWFAEQVNSGNASLNAVLTTDIVVNETVLAADGSLGADPDTLRMWRSIGDDDTENIFKGTFDGQGHTISGLYFSNDSNESDVICASLFGFSAGIIQNVGLEDSYFNYYYAKIDGQLIVNGMAAGICAINNGQIVNCYNAGTILGYCASGICVINSDNGSIENCYNTGVIRGSWLVAGICNMNAGSMKDCYNNNSDITVMTDSTIIDENDEISYASGICNNNGSSGRIENCYHVGQVSGADVNNNICNLNAGQIENSYYDCNICNKDAITQNKSSAVAKNVEGKTTKQFASGEVTYLLNGDQSVRAFYQNLAKEKYPTLNQKSKVVMQLEMIYDESFGEDATTNKTYHNAGDTIALETSPDKAYTYQYFVNGKQIEESNYTLTGNTKMTVKSVPVEIELSEIDTIQLTCQKKMTLDLTEYLKNFADLKPVQFQLDADSKLPDGLKLTEDGMLSGTPKKAATVKTTIVLTAENGSTKEMHLVFIVNAPVTTTTTTITTTTTRATTTTKPTKTTTTKVTTTIKPNKTTTTKATTTTKPNKTTTTKVTTTTKPSKTTTTKVTTTTKPSKTTTTKVTTTTKPSKTTTTKATTTTKPSKTTTTNATTTTKPSKVTTTTNATTTTKPNKTTTTNATTTTKPSKTTTTKATTTTKPSKTTTTKVTTTTKPSKTTTTKATTTTKPSKTTTTNATTTTKPSKVTTTTNATTTTKPNKTTTTKATTTTITTTTNTAIPSYGDVNLDGKVDILDAVYLNKYLATLIQFSDAQIANADCYQDGILDDQDTTALVHFIILLIDDLPVQPTEK